MMDVGEEQFAKGNYIMNVLRVELICKSCKRLRATQLKCVHMLDQYPPWKSEEKMRVLQILLAKQREVLMRESMGVLEQDSNEIFDQDTIDDFINRPTFLANDIPPKYVFVCVDPNGGGISDKKSRIGLVAACRYESKTVVSHCCIASLVFSSRPVFVNSSSCCCC